MEEFFQLVINCSQPQLLIIPLNFSTVANCMAVQLSENEAVFYQIVAEIKTP